MSEETKDTAVNEAASEEIKAEERFVVFEEALEAILFAAGHAVPYATLARVFDTTPTKIKDRVFEYAMKYNRPDEKLQRGVVLLTYPDECQLCTKESYLPEIRDALGVRKSGTLSTAALETLAVVAYNQPVTRVFVDTIRKVDSSYAMNSLIDRGLIECVGRLDVPGRPMQYGTTSDFLRCFGIPSLEGLPPTSEELIDMFNKVKDTSEAEQLTMDIDSEEATIDADTKEDAEVATSELASEAFDNEPDEPSAEDDIVDID